MGFKRLGAGRHRDRGDAERLAQMLALGTVPAVRGPPAEIRAIRALLQQAAACGRTATAWKHRAKRRLLRLGWAVPRTQTAAAWLAEHGQELDRDTQVLVTSALTWAQQAAAEAEALQAEVLRRRAGRPARGWLWSLPGLGPWAAAVVWAWFGDPTRFRHARPRTLYAHGAPIGRSGLEGPHPSPGPGRTAPGPGGGGRVCHPEPARSLAGGIRTLGWTGGAAAGHRGRRTAMADCGVDGLAQGPLGPGEGASTLSEPAECDPGDPAPPAPLSPRRAARPVGRADAGHRGRRAWKRGRGGA